MIFFFSSQLSSKISMGLPGKVAAIPISHETWNDHNNERWKKTCLSTGTRRGGTQMPGPWGRFCY